LGLIVRSRAVRDCPVAAPGAGALPHHSLLTGFVAC
jgi:hypothetical protein